MNNTTVKSLPVSDRFIIVEEFEDDEEILSRPQKTFRNNSSFDTSTLYTNDYSPKKSIYNDSLSTSISTLYPQETSSSSSPIADSPYCQNHLIQGLKPHNVAFITLCSVFGTGLFITSTTILKTGGPLSLFLGYLITGAIAYQVITALTDMSTYIPLPDNFSGFAERFVDPALGFATGYAFLLTFLLFAPNQISAATLTMSLWIDSEKLTPAVWILIFISVISLVNYCKITKYAYLVDFFILIKLAIYFVLAITFICLICGFGPKREVLGFKFWKNPGAMASYNKIENKSLGSITALFISTIKSVWSYVGIESFSVAAIETINPRDTIPKAKNILFYLLFPTYLTMAFLIGLCVAYDDKTLILSQTLNPDNAKSSAVFIALYNASLGVMENFVNASLLIFIFSAANTGFYLSTRILYSLSASGIAPKLFMKTNKNGIPIYSFLLVLAFNFIAFVSIRAQSLQTYHYFVDATSMFSLINWACILITHIRFLSAFKRQNLISEFKNYVPKSSTNPIYSIITLILVIIMILGNNLGVCIDYSINNNFALAEFLSGIIALPIFTILFVGFKLYFNTSIVSLNEADLYFYRDVVDNQERIYLQNKMSSGIFAKKLNWYERLFNKIKIYSNV